MCEEYESYDDRTGRPVAVRTVEFLVCVKCDQDKRAIDDPAHEEFLLQRYGERIEKLSQQGRLSKFCTMQDS